MTHVQLQTLILGPPFAATALYALWAAIEIYRMRRYRRRYSKLIRERSVGYTMATMALHRPGVDLTTDPDFQWAVKVANDPIPDYRRTWPSRKKV
jgi:hypothetical protein